MSYGATPEEVVRLALEALSDRDTSRMRPLLADHFTVRTGRASHEGADAALAWARKGYDHLDRRWTLDTLEPAPGEGGDQGLLIGHGRVEYVWRETGEVADSTPTVLLIALEDGLLGRLEIFDDLDSLLATLATGA